MHMDDGKTLSNEDCYPHNVSTRGYNQKQITSVERLVNGRHIRVKKSPMIAPEWFVATEEDIPLDLQRAHRLPKIVISKMIGFYIKDTDPPVQIKFGMAPLSHDVRLQVHQVKEVTAKGLNASRVHKKPRNDMPYAWQCVVHGAIYSIEKTPEITNASWDQKNKNITIETASGTKLLIETNANTRDVSLSVL